VTTAEDWLESVAENAPRVRHRELRGLPAYGVTDGVPTEITLLAFDPGGTTGWALATFNPETGEIADDTKRWGELDKQGHHTQLWSLLRLTLDDHPHLMVVTEDYTPEFARAQNYIALEYIGVMEAFCKLNKVSFERQSRNIKPFWTLKKMRAVRFWPPGKKHAQDAARHWLTYAAKQSRALHINLAKSFRE